MFTKDGGALPQYVYKNYLFLLVFQKYKILFNLFIYLSFVVCYIRESTQQWMR
jgi:hypothetical protein